MAEIVTRREHHLIRSILRPTRGRVVRMAFVTLLLVPTLLGVKAGATFWRVRTGDAFQDPDSNRSALSISLRGENPFTQECHEPFEDPGATAISSSGRIIPVQVSGTIDATTPGTYVLTYTALDNQNSVSAERTVKVLDTTAPEIALEEGHTITLNCGEIFNEPGASAMDDCEGSLPVTISGDVDPNIPGTYVLSYAAKDKYDNTKVVQRTIIVGGSETSPPTIKLNGKGQITLECGSDFTDPGATATTPCAGFVPVITSGNVDVRVPETYFISYTASSGEARAETSRVITIVDTTPPVISLKGANPLTIELGQEFTDPGAIARDGCAGSFGAASSGTVDSNKIGSYTITYAATDPSGNEAMPVTRTVNVIDKVTSFSRLCFLSCSALVLPALESDRAHSWFLFRPASCYPNSN